MKISIIIPIYNQTRMTIDCLNDVIRTQWADLEIIAVDDGSTEPVFSTLTRLFPSITVIKNDSNLGFAQTVNKGIEASTGQLVCLLNNDIRLPNSKWLKLMVDEMQYSSLDLTAPAGGRMNSNWDYIPGETKKKGSKFEYLVGWALLVKKEVFNKIGTMPTNFGKGFFEDVLFGIRAKKAGFKSGITEGTCIEHKYHATFKSLGVDLGKEYSDKRKIFLEIVKKECIE